MMSDISDNFNIIRRCSKLFVREPAQTLKAVKLATSFITIAAKLYGPQYSNVIEVEKKMNLVRYFLNCSLDVKSKNTCML